MKKVFYIVFLLMSVNYAVCYGQVSREEAIEKRIMPVARAHITQSVGEKAEMKKVVKAAKFDVQAKYKTVCAACHATGAAGAPKVGDKDAWAKFLREDIEVVYYKAIHGNKGMPPRGTCSQCTDDQIKKLVDYMVAQSK